MKKNIILLLFYFVPFISFAQIPVLEGYKKEGLEQNKSFLSHQMLHHSFLEKEKQFSRLEDLQISAGFAPSPIETRLGAQNMQFSAVQRFPWFGTLKAKLALFESQNSVHNKVLSEMGANLEFQIEKSWFQLYEIRLNKKVLRSKIELAELMESLTEQNLKSNAKFSIVDFLSIQMKREDWENELADLDLAETTEQYAFNTLLSKDINEEVISIDSLLDLHEFIPTGKQVVYAVSKQDLKTESAKESIDLFNRSIKPKWSVGFKYFVIDEGNNQIENNGKDAFMFNVGLKIPFQIKQNKHALMEVTHKWHSEQIKLERVKEEYEFLVAKLLLEIQKQERYFNFYSEQKQKVEQVVQLQLEAYSHGNGDYEKLLNSMDRMLGLERKRIASLVQQRTQVSYYQSLFEMKK